MKPTYEWDEQKAQSNFRKHEISFDEAETVFDDPLAITIRDPNHSQAEVRFVDIGQSDKDHVLVVTYTERGKQTRLISARIATRAERIKYEEEKNL
jgi:uncharacterized DUF497 family protein